MTPSDIAFASIASRSRMKAAGGSGVLAENSRPPCDTLRNIKSKRAAKAPTERVNAMLIRVPSVNGMPDITAIPGNESTQQCPQGPVSSGTEVLQDIEEVASVASDAVTLFG
jgi:hypothetical protein